MSDLKPCERCGMSMPASTKGLCEDCNREFHEKVALLEQMCTEATNRRAEALLDTINEAPAVDLKDGECVMLGFEGQVDAVIPIREPRPIVFRLPLRMTMRQMIAPSRHPPDKPEPLRVAEYRRVGESTYQRET